MIILYAHLLSRSSFFFLVFFFNRHVESTVEQRYAPVDQQAHVMGPRVLPSGHPTDNGPRRGPLDPSGPYALPQKKNKPKKPRHEPAIGKRLFNYQSNNYELLNCRVWSRDHGLLVWF